MDRARIELMTTGHRHDTDCTKRPGTITVASPFDILEHFALVSGFMLKTGQV